MSESCEKCRFEYAVSRDIDGRAWRYVCPCEAKQRCFKGAHPATHVYLGPLGSPVKYVCDEHGVSLEDRPNPPPAHVALPVEKAPAPVPKRAPVAYVPPKVQMRVIVPEKRIPDTTVITAAIVKADIANDKFQVVCTGCQHVHQFNRRKVSPGTAPQCFRVDCPKCGEGGYKPVS